MLRWALGILILLSGASASRADLDPEKTKPYQLRVVLHVASHRVLTPNFQTQLEREIRDSIQAALGDLGYVLITRNHPLLRAILADGLEARINGWKEVSEVKTHFVLIDFVDGRYEIRARQFDGLTGMPSPVVRRSVTSDRRLVARSAALMVDSDFGLVGTITKITGRDTVEVTLKGGSLLASTVERLKKGDVFAVAQISPTGAGLQSVRVDDALLQVTAEPKEGVCP